MKENLAVWHKRLESLLDRIKADASETVVGDPGKWKAAGLSAAAKLEELHATTGDAWDTLKVEMETLWHTVHGLLSKGEEQQRAREDVVVASRPTLTLVAPIADADAAASSVAKSA